jgi:hypothetical protein
MGQEKMLWQSGAFMIARDNINGNPRTGYLKEGFIGSINDSWRDLAFREEISPMDDQVHPVSPAIIQDSPVVCEEILSPSAPLDPGLNWLIESQMGIREEEDLD